MATKRQTATRRRDAITPETPMRVAVYTRRSTDDEHQPYTIEAQTEKLTAYVNSQPGWQITATFTDDASGATLDRPGLTKALAAARAAKYDLLLVYRLDRFSRRIRDLATLMDELEDIGVHFRSATEPFDTSSAAGRLFVQMLGAFAEFEREVIIDRVISGMERKAANGQWTHGPRPYGYLVDPSTHRLVPHPDEQHVVREIFTRYAATRAGTRAIADQLNAHGKRTRNSKPWSGHTIGRMLANRLYLGEVGFRDVTVHDAHPPLVDADLFERCQRILAVRGEIGSQRAASNSDYHLTGRITCPNCGHKYVGTSATGKLRRYRYYTCFSRTRYGRAGCAASRIDADLIDTAIMDALIDFYSRTDLITAAIAAEQTLRATGAQQHTAELNTVTGQITTTEAAIDRYLTAFENGTLDERTCGSRIRDLTTKLDQLRVRRDDLAELVHAEPIPPSLSAIEQLRRDLAHVLANGTPGQRKAIIETHIAEIKIEGTNLIPIFMIPTDDEGPTETSADPSTTTFRTLLRVVVEGSAEPNGLLKCTQSPRVPVTRYPGASVQGGIGRERGHRRHQPALPAQHHLPQVVRLRHERVARERVQDEPGTLVYLGLQLLGVPPGIAGEDAEAVQFTGERFGVAGEVDGADDALHPAEAVRIRTGAGAGQADGGLGLHRAALEHHGRLRGQGIPAGQHLADRHLGGAVQHHAEGTGFLVRDQQHHSPLEVRVLQRRRRDEESSRESISRHARDHAQTRGSSGR